MCSLLVVTSMVLLPIFSKVHRACEVNAGNQLRLMKQIRLGLRKNVSPLWFRFDVSRFMNSAKAHSLTDHFYELKTEKNSCAPFLLLLLPVHHSTKTPTRELQSSEYLLIQENSSH